MNLHDLREELDAIDRSLIPLLEKRLTAARAIGEIKAERGMPVLQPEREKHVLQTRLAMVENAELLPQIEKLLRALMEASRSVQERTVESEKRDATCFQDPSF